MSQNDEKGYICVFVCRWCSLLGVERAGRERLPLPAGLRVIPVSCAGSVSAEIVIEALVNGASGVAVLGCHLGGCRHNDANRDTHAALETLADLLDTAGIDRRRLLISWGTAHEAEGYARLMRAFADQLKQLPACTVPASSVHAHAQLPVQKQQLPSTFEQDKRLQMLAGEALDQNLTVLALTRAGGSFIPELFTHRDELSRMTAGPKYPVAKLAGRILRDLAAGSLQRQNEDYALRSLALDLCKKSPLAVACRACDARALYAQASLRQFPVDSFIVIPIPCSSEQVALCNCENKSWPGEPSPELPTPVKHDAAFWQEQFSRCVQCHWCRSACPVCICPECSIENNTALPAGYMPPSPLGYHLIRSFHVADACVCCGACQDACPQGLPLLELHKAVKYGVASHGLRNARLEIEKQGTASPLWQSGLATGVKEGHV